jgi:glutathione S-transferase
MSSNQLKVHSFELSGHCHRVLLFLSLLEIPYEEVRIDLLGGQQRSAEFLKLNSYGQVPVLEDGATVISDSNAILVFLALKYDPKRKWYPSDLLTIANIQRWLSVAAGPLAFGNANMRAGKIFNRPIDPRAHEISKRLLDVMDFELSTRQYICTKFSPTIADIALYSYVAHSPEGGIDLRNYKNINAWLEKIENLNGFIGMNKSPIAALT